MSAHGDSVAAAGTALVVHGNPRMLEDISDDLRSAGFQVSAHSTVQPAVEVANSGGADIAVVCAKIALEYLNIIGKEADNLLPKSIPVVLVARSAAEVTSHPELVMRSSDYLLVPIDSQELLHRVNTAVHRNRLREARRNESAVLRERIRHVSDQIRHTNAPSEMVEITLAGLGEALEAEEVSLILFDDHRVSVGSSRWQRGAGKVIPYEHPDNLMDEMRELGTELWRTSGSVAVSGGRLDDVPAHLHGIRDALQGFSRSSLAVPIGEGASAFGLLWVIADRGDRKWSDVEISLLQYLIGNLAYGVIQGQLIIRQQQVVDRLQELDAAKDGFVATVHHELRTPLSSILGYVELLQDGDGGELPPPAHRMLEIIQRNGHRLSSLVENVLALSVLDAGTHVGSAPVDVADLVDSVAMDLLPIASAKNVLIKVDAPGTGQRIKGMWELLARAFVNVLSNAVKFTPDGGVVAVRFESDDTMVRVFVEDSGIGIPAEELPHLLTRFYRASNSVAAEIPGTGLGLSITAAAIDRHGGSLSIESELGAGTTVRIELPRA